MMTFEPDQNAIAVKCGAGTANCMTLHDTKGSQNRYFLSFPANPGRDRKMPVSLGFYL